MAGISMTGHHVIADLYGVAPHELTKGAELLELFTSTLRATGFNVIDVVGHQFIEKGAGFTGIVLLAESHAALHTYPEYQYVAVDIFSCSQIDPEPVIQVFARRLGATRVVVQIAERRICPIPAQDKRPGGAGREELEYIYGELK
jgi:S-adenosylmethionine decarboxylase